MAAAASGVALDLRPCGGGPGARGHAEPDPRGRRYLGGLPRESSAEAPARPGQRVSPDPGARSGPHQYRQSQAPVMSSPGPVDADGRRLSSGRVGLVGAVDRDADVVGLLRGERGQLDPEGVEVQPGHLLVEVLGEHVHLVLVLAGLGEQLHLGHGLVGERVRHHEARVPGGVAQVEQAALGEHDHGVAVGEDPLVDLGLDVDPLDAVDGWRGRPCRSRCRSDRCCPRWPGASSGPCGRP